MQKTDIIATVCDRLLRGDRDAASRHARERYPFVPGTTQRRQYTPYQQLKVFYRDGFIDRYSGERLLFPGTIRLLSVLMPDEFPAHKNWKMSECHLLYWELFPTIDHVQPAARSGADDESNWVCTSMLRNQAKSNWTLEELNWKIMPPGDPKQWDGLTSWFLEYVRLHPTIVAKPGYLRRWWLAARRLRESGD
ncbi:MAG: HNH endonuclease [Phycisphaerales bacterium]|nr:HNH endonuclease [Phycisphaerales bacterium]MCB9858664.1 HNH endonuclease [Phycisphaerales bacterium]